MLKLRFIVIIILVIYTNVYYKYDSSIGIKYKYNIVDNLKSYLYYMDDDVTIYMDRSIDTNMVFLIPASKVFCSLAYFDNTNFKTY